MNMPGVALVSLSRLAVGGIETNMLQLIRGLGGEYAFTVIGTIAEPFRSRAAALGAACVDLPPGGKLDPGRILRLRSAFRAGNYSLIHTHDTRGGLLGRLAAKGTAIAVLHTVHTPSFFLPRSPAAVFSYRAMERILNAFFSDGVIFVSPTIRRMYLDGRLVNAAKAHLIPNGLEADWLDMPPKKVRAGGGITFLYVGRLAVEKGMHLLADAFSRAAARLPRARLMVVGDGPLRETILQAAGRGGWAERLEMTGGLDRDRTRRKMRAADAFILPSRFESMSYTLLEAMACGLPCIAADVGGNRDLIEDGKTGLLVPAGDPTALGEAMIRLAKSAALRNHLGKAGRLQAREYPMIKMVEKTGQIYRQTIAGKSKPG
jgi:glycosyltransferase involved in cell wall biosynthesis